MWITERGQLQIKENGFGIDIFLRLSNICILYTLISTSNIIYGYLITINNSVNPAAQTCHLLVLKCDFNQVT